MDDLWAPPPWYKRLDYPLLGAALTLCLLGWLVLDSATGHDSESVRQGVSVLLGLVLLAVATVVDYRRWDRLALPIYVGSLVALALVRVHGYSAGGAQRWIALGPLTVQPSEPAKLALILVLARLLACPTRTRVSLRTLCMAGVFMAAPAALIALQPDLGTALVLVAITGAMVWMAGAPTLLLALLTVLALALAPHVMHQYQTDRMMVFMVPELDPGGLGYSLHQSQMAVGSGQWTGEGLYHGQLTQRGFVPASRTDFIFSVVGEELGFVGGAGLLALYFLLVWRIRRAAAHSSDRFGALLAIGVATLFGFEALVNLGMTIGMLPVVGIPLPLVSYGGSAVLVNLAAVGMVLNLAMHPPQEDWGEI